jgi:excisionase family DNA binding protein
MQQQPLALPDGREFISVSEFIALTGVARSSAYRLLQADLPFVRVGRRSVLIPVDAVRAWLSLNVGRATR